MSEAESAAEPRTSSWLGPLVAGLIALVHGGVLLLRGHAYDIDRLTQSLPAAAAFRRAWAQGDWPLWAPGIWAGHPIHAEGQYGFFSPFKLVNLFTPDAVAALDAEQLLSLVLCAAGGAGAARLLGRSAPGAAATGVVWALGGSMLVWQTNPGMVATHALLPLALALGLRQRWFALGLTLAFAILAGHPYGYALTFVAAGVAWLVGDDERRPLSTRLRFGLAAVGLALALGAVQWLPSADLVLRSDRWTGGGAARANPVHVADLRHWVVPWIDARVRYSIEGGVLTYVGLPALLLALVGAQATLKERAGRVVLALGLGALVLALLASLGGGVSDVPLLRLLRGPSKLLFLVFAALALCAASGVDRLRALHPAAAWIAVAVIALDVGSYAQRHVDSIDRASLRRAPALARALPAGARLRVLGVESPWGKELPPGEQDRLAFLDGALPLDANVGTLFGFTHLEGYSPLMAPRALAFARSFGPRRLRRGSVTHVVTGPKRALPPPFQPVHQTPRWSLQRLPAARPWAFACAATRRASDPTTALALADQTPLDTVIVESERDLPLGGPGVRAVEVERWSPSRIELRPRLDQRSIVAVADSWDPGWFATVDGRRAEVLPIDGAFKGVVAPAGSRRVVFAYSPGAFRLGLGVSGWTLLALLVCGVLAVRRRWAFSAA